MRIEVPNRMYSVCEDLQFSSRKARLDAFPTLRNISEIKVVSRVVLIRPRVDAQAESLDRRQIGRTHTRKCFVEDAVVQRSAKRWVKTFPKASLHEIVR